MSRKYIKDSSLLVRSIHQSQLLFCRGQGVKASQWLYYLLPPDISRAWRQSLGRVSRLPQTANERGAIP